MAEAEDNFGSFERDEMPPIEMFEALFAARSWSHERITDDELSAEYKGSWTSYQLRIVSRDEDPVAQMLILPDISVSKSHHKELYETLALVNEQLWLGHFDLWSNNGVVLFRHAMTLGASGLIDVEQAQTLVDAAIDECERFYPVFQFVLWGGKSPAEAIASALIDTYGEA